MHQIQPFPTTHAPTDANRVLIARQLEPFSAREICWYVQARVQDSRLARHQLSKN